MTAKAVIINMSNWANEYLKVEWANLEPKVLAPGEFTIMNPHGNDLLRITLVEQGEANGYEPPAFPARAISLSEERRLGPSGVEAH